MKLETKGDRSHIFRIRLCSNVSGSGFEFFSNLRVRLLFRFRQPSVPPKFSMFVLKQWHLWKPRRLQTTQTTNQAEYKPRRIQTTQTTNHADYKPRRLQTTPENKNWLWVRVRKKTAKSCQIRLQIRGHLETCVQGFAGKLCFRVRASLFY